MLLTFLLLLYLLDFNRFTFEIRPDLPKIVLWVFSYQKLMLIFNPKVVNHFYE